MVTLHTCAAGSKYVLPSRYDPDRCMSQATLYRVTQLIVERAKAASLQLEPFTVHGLRRTRSTLRNEAGFNAEWIERCLAHEEERSSHSVYNKAEYAEQRRHMLQQWASMIDAWAAGETYAPTFCAGTAASPGYRRCTIGPSATGRPAGPGPGQRLRIRPASPRRHPHLADVAVPRSGLPTPGVRRAACQDEPPRCVAGRDSEPTRRTPTSKRLIERVRARSPCRPV